MNKNKNIEKLKNNIGWPMNKNKSEDIIKENI